MNLINKAIDNYILHEILTLRHEEQRLSVALAKADDITSEKIIGALARLRKHAESLDEMLVYLEPISESPLGALAA